MNVSRSAHVFNNLADRADAFEDRYKRMIDEILGLNKPTALCTIYYPRMEQTIYQKLAVAALASFNDVIIRQAFLNGLPLIDLRLVCNEGTDYANAIEPSVQGGFKIARIIEELVDNHNFEANRTSVYF